MYTHIANIHMHTEGKTSRNVWITTDWVPISIGSTTHFDQMVFWSYMNRKLSAQNPLMVGSKVNFTAPLSDTLSLTPC